MRGRAALFLATMGAALVFSGGVAVALNTVQCKAWTTDCFGTGAPDLMKGSTGSDWMYGKGRNDTLRGFGNTSDNEEELHGQGGNDKLYGGSGQEILYGGPGNDALIGDDSGSHFVDAYQFGANSWGEDTITDATTGVDVGGFPASNTLILGPGGTTP